MNKPGLFKKKRILMIVGLMALSTGAYAQDSAERMGGHDHSAHDRPIMTEEAVQAVMATGVDEKLGETLALSAEFYDENGVRVRLGDLVDKPTVILPIFYYCPVVCPLLLSNLAAALPDVPFEAGQDYRVLALSFNDEETPDVAKDSKEDYLKLLPESFPAGSWSFLTGDLKNIRAFTESIGYRFKKTAPSTFVHPNALVIVSGEGKIIRYIYGSSYLGADIGMGISEAREGRPGISIKRILSFCFNYDPAGRRYIVLFFKIAALATVVLLVLFFIFFLRSSDEDDGVNETAGQDSDESQTAKRNLP